MLPKNLAAIFLVFNEPPHFGYFKAILVIEYEIGTTMLVLVVPNSFLTQFKKHGFWAPTEVDFFCKSEQT